MQSAQLHFHAWHSMCALPVNWSVQQDVHVHYFHKATHFFSKKEKLCIRKRNWIFTSVVLRIFQWNINSRSTWKRIFNLLRSMGVLRKHVAWKGAVVRLVYKKLKYWSVGVSKDGSSKWVCHRWKFVKFKLWHNGYFFHRWKHVWDWRECFYCPDGNV